MLSVETFSGTMSIGQKARAALNTWVSVYTGMFFGETVKSSRARDEKVR